MEESTMKKHVTLVAALHIGFSTLGILAAMALFFTFSFAGSFLGETHCLEAMCGLLCVPHSSFLLEKVQLLRAW